MYKFQKRDKIKRIIYSWPMLAFALFVIIWLGVKVLAVYKSERLSRANRDQAEEMRQLLEEEYTSINSEIQFLKTEKGVEKEIRDKFRVVKEGEQLAIIVNSDANRPGKTPTVKAETIWTKLMSLLSLLNFKRD